jgi:hypothetical protein
MDKKLMAFLGQNRNIIIVIVVALIIWAIYQYGKKKALDCSWYDKLLGNCVEGTPTKTQYTDTSATGNVFNPKGISDAIFEEYESHWTFKPNGENINLVWRGFNALSNANRIAVVNDWNMRYLGRDRAGWFTGDYGTLRQTIERYQGNLQPQAEIALNWMISNNIS